MPGTRRALPLLLAAAPACLSIATAPRSRAAEPGWKLAWSDEFSGPDVDRGKWGFELGNGFPAGDQWIRGWGNDELEDYTDRLQNVYVRDGMLHLRAVKEEYQGFHYTSAKLVTRGRFAKTYGRFEIRAKLPRGQGYWPALWLLPAREEYGGWAASGEVDMLEARGRDPSRVSGTIHFGGTWPRNTSSGGEYVLPAGQTNAEFHVYTFEWEPGVMRWLVDRKPYSTKRFWWSGKGANPRPDDPSTLNPWPAPFDRPFFLVMNLAVGGRFGGNPDATTSFPGEMVVDYVRVYDRIGGYGPTPPRPDGRG